MLSQGLYHLSLSVMSHDHTSVRGTAPAFVHVHEPVLPSNILDHYAGVQSESMLYAHLMAAVVSISVLFGAEKLLAILRGCMSLRTARTILRRATLETPTRRNVPGFFTDPSAPKRQHLVRLIELRGPPVAAGF